jgi:hypothetical protein
MLYIVIQAAHFGADGSCRGASPCPCPPIGSEDAIVDIVEQ